MAIYNLPNYNTANGFGMPLNMRRANPDPLDNSSVWASYAEALEYAKNDPVAYVGQLITVVTAPTEEGVKEHTVDVYKIELDENGEGTLVKVGSSEEVAELDADVQKLIVDVANAVTNISTLTTTIGTIESDLGTAKNDIDKAEESIAANIEAIEAVEADVEQLKTDVDLVEELAASNKLRLDEYDTAKANYALKDDIATAKSEAIAAAKTETENQISSIVSQYLTGEGAADTIDTLQEIADWIADDKAGATKLVADVKAIQDDYLKTADKTELSEAITAVDNKVGALPEGITSTTLVGYVQEVVTNDLATLSGNVETLEGKVKTIEETTLPGINTEIDDLDTRVKALEDIDHDHENKSVLDTITSNKVSSWDDAAAKVHEHTNKAVLDTIDQDKIDLWDSVANKADNNDLVTLTTRVGAAETAISTTLPEAINKKVTQTYTEIDGEQVADRLLTRREADILAKLSLNEDGNVETGQTVTAGNVEGLAEWITNNGPKALEGKIGTAQLTDEVKTKLDGAITQITVNGLVLNKDNGNVDIPIATTTAHGTVMLGSEFKLAESGAMEVNSINVNKLTQTSGEVLELNGGNASGSFN